MNNVKFTYDKLQSVKFGFSIFDMFNQVLLNLFTFLINTTNQEVYVYHFGMLEEDSTFQISLP